MRPRPLARAALASFIALVTTIMAAAPALAQQVSLQASTSEYFAGLPFVLTLRADGFDETPEPQTEPLSIAGADVAFAGATPNVSSFIRVENGRRTESHSVTWLLRWRVTPAKPGPCTIPVIHVTQGSKSAATQATAFGAKEVPTTTDMRLRVTLPPRPVWVGEAFTVTIDWLLHRDPSEQSFIVPLFQRDEAVEIGAPDADAGAPKLGFSAVPRDIELPYERAQESLDGVDYTRFRFLARVTATRAGVLDLPPARVIARLQTGNARDRFGFAVGQFFKAEDAPRRLEIRDLPAEGRPASFRGAVGTGFTLEAKADRSVVRAGDPVALELTVRGKGLLDGLALPPLAGEGGLPAALFSVPDEAPAGEKLDDGGRRFRVSVRVRSADAREVPPIAFPYFNPESGAYQIARSEPIALSVRGSAVVGAGDVVSAARIKSGGEQPIVPSASAQSGAHPETGGATLSGVDLALSDPRFALRDALDVQSIAPWLIALYVGPLAILAWRLLRARTADERAARRSARGTLARCESAIGAAMRAASARDGAGAIAMALRALRREIGQGGGDAGDGAALDAVIARCEAMAFDPKAVSGALPEAIAREASDAARRFASDDRPSTIGRGSAPALVFLSIAAGAMLARAEDAALAAARASYGQALSESDRDRRVAAFSRAEGLLGDLARSHPRAPEIAADWGAAAIGARDMGTAVLALRRALQLEPGLARARSNLAWVREQMPAGSGPSPGAGGGDASGMVEAMMLAIGLGAPPARLLAGAALFALATLLWPSSRRALRSAAVALLALSAIATASALLASAGARDAVVLADGSVLRAADSPGAAPALPRPLAAGCEVTVVEAREGWRRVEVAGGSRGWLPASALASVSMLDGGPATR